MAGHQQPVHFIAISERAGGAWLAAHAAHAARLVGEGTAILTKQAGLWSARRLPDDDDGQLAVVARQPAQICAERRTLVALREVAARWRRDGPPAVDDYTPPFALVGIDRERRTIVALADYVGLSHLYCYAGDGIAALSSSASALARLFDLQASPEALLGLALTGAMIGTDTPIAGVAKLPPGCRATLADGALAVTPNQRGVAADAAAEPPLRRIMSELSLACPDAELELSGGLDSRLLLAALPAERRSRHPAFTLGEASSADRRVAGLIAGREGLRHLGLDPAEALDTPEFGAQLRAAALASEFSANPLDRVMMAAVNARHPVTARFNGSNGETLRGFYFAGQPLVARPDRALAERLVRWRLVANDVVDPALFDPAWYRDGRHATEARLVETVLGHGAASWGESLERLYLGERMHRWCGVSYSSTQHDRQILAPFFDRAFVDWALAMPSGDKSGSRAAARLLAELDPGLARLPLDTGLSPVQLLGRGPAAVAGRLTRHMGKLTRKVAQRLGRSPASTLATADATAQFYKRVGPDGLALEPLARLPMFDADALDRFATGAWLPDRPTLGFIINSALLAATIEAR